MPRDENHFPAWVGLALFVSIPVVVVVMAIVLLAAGKWVLG